MGTAKRKRIFVAMPFRSEHDGIFGVIEEAASLLNADVIRLDEQSFAGSIVSQIRNEIEGADVITAIVFRRKRKRLLRDRPRSLSEEAHHSPRF